MLAETRCVFVNPSSKACFVTELLDKLYNPLKSADLIKSLYLNLSRVQNVFALLLCELHLTFLIILQISMTLMSTCLHCLEIGHFAKIPDDWGRVESGMGND